MYTRVVRVRRYSSLAEKLRDAATGDMKSRRALRVNDVDEHGEPYRELFVMPKRKLNAQVQLERMTGRATVEQRSRPDINDRLCVRRPRSEEMDERQDWPSVWPAARSFASSVVPLPIRMGTRKYPEKRAPFKKEGNLELVKIPNFLHLTPLAIERHCRAIRKFCTPFPPELKENPGLAEEELPLRVTYSDYVHQGTNIRDGRARVVTVQMKVSSMGLSSTAKEKFIRLAGNRYEEETDTLTIVTDRCHTRAQNLDYAYYLLTALYHESNKVEAWEELKDTKDRLKVEFAGSTCEQNLVHLLQKLTAAEGFESPVKEVGPGAEKEKIIAHPKVQEFAQMWMNYRNTEETEESTREYGRRVRELLGLPSLG